MKALVATVALILTGCAAPSAEIPESVLTPTPVVTTNTPVHKYSFVLVFSLRKYPNIADHIRDAQAAGESKICTIDRPHASLHRKQSLAGIPTAPGKDRDEYPAAMCKEGGTGADVRLVPSKENRSAGSYMGNALEDYANGTHILIKVTK